MAINLDEKALLNQYRQAKDIEIERLLGQYGTSLAETREMYPQLLTAVQQKQMTTTFPTQSVFFTPSEAADIGLSLQEGWMLKLTPKGEDWTSSLVTPEKWEITEDDLYISPTGQQYSRADIQALLSMPAGLAETIPQMGGPVTVEGLTEQGKSLYQEYQGAGGELDVAGWLDLRENQQVQTEQVFGRVFPEQDIEEVLAYMQENPEGFLADIREIGPTQDMVGLLKYLEFQDENGTVRHLSDEEIQGLFGTEAVPAYVSESKLKDTWDAFLAGGMGMIQGIETYLFTNPPAKPTPETANMLVNAWATKTTPIAPEFTYQYATQKYEQGLEATVAGYLERRDKQQQFWISHPELAPNPRYLVSPWDDPSLLKDPGYWGYSIANSAAYSLAVMGAMMIPYVGIPMGFALAAMPEAGHMLDLLVDKGVPLEEATGPAQWYGLAAGGIEFASDLPFLGLVAKPFKTAMQPFWNTVLRGFANGSVKAIAAGLVTTQGEALEEVFTQVIQNAIIQHYDDTQSLLEGVGQAYIQGAIASLPFGAVGGFASYTTFRANLSQETGEEYDALVDTLQRSGLATDQAQVQAANSIARTDEGAAELETAIQAARLEYLESQGVDSVEDLPEVRRQAQAVATQLQENNPSLVVPGGNTAARDLSNIPGTLTTGADDVLNIATNEDIQRGLLIPNWIKSVLKKTEQIPGIGKAQKAILGWRSTVDLENDTTEAVVGRSAVVYGAITRMGVNTAKVMVGTLRNILATPASYFGFNESGYSSQMAGKALPQYRSEGNIGTLEDVLTHPERYDWTGMDKGLEYVTRFNAIQNRIFSLLQREGVALDLVNEAWMHRVVTGRTVEGEVVETRGRPGRTGRAVGAKPSYEKPRAFKTMAEGIQASIQYEPNPEVSIGSYIEEAYKKIAGNRVEADLQAFGQTPSARLEERFPGLAEQAEQTKEDLADAARLHELVLRAKRGEKLSEQTLRAMERRFPKLGRRLRALVQEGSATEKQIRQLLKQNERLINDLKTQVARAKTVAGKPAEVVKVEVTRVETGDIEPHVETKYTRLPGEESEAEAKVIHVELVEEGELTPENVEKALSALNPQDAQREIEALEATIADQLGNLIETYRYESWEDGQNLERYLDSLLQVTQKYRQSLGLPETVDLTIEPLTGKARPFVKPEPVVIPDEVKLREAFKLMEYEDRLAFRNTMETQLEEIGRMLEEQGVQVETLTETFESDRARPFIDIVAKSGEYKGEIRYLTVNQYRILTGAKWVIQTSEKMGKKIKTKVLVGGKMPIASIMTPDGKKVRWEYAMDEVAQELGYESDEALKKAIETALDMKQSIDDYKTMIDSGTYRLGAVKRMLRVLTDVESTATVVEAEVVEPEPEAAAAVETTAEGEALQAEISRLETDLMKRGPGFLLGIQHGATEANLSDAEYLARLREIVGEAPEGAPGPAIEGPEGEIKEQAALYQAAPVAMSLDQFKTILSRVINESNETLKLVREQYRRFRVETRGKITEAETAEIRANRAMLKEWLETLRGLQKNPEEYYPRLQTELPNVYKMLYERAWELRIIPRNLPRSPVIAEGMPETEPDYGEVPQAAPGSPEAGLQVDMFGYATPVTPKGRGERRQISLDDYKKLVERYEEEGQPMPYMRVKPKIDGIAELSGDTEFQQEIFSPAEEKTAEQRRTAFDDLAREAKALMEARKAPYWQARAARARAMEIVSQPGIGEGYLPMPFAGGRIFNQDFIDASNKFFGLDQGRKELVWISDVAGILRMAKASLDFSAMAIQGLPSFGLAHAYMLINPRIGVKLMGGWYKALGLSTAAFFHTSVFYNYMAKNQDAVLQRVNGFAGTSRAIDYFDVLRSKTGMGKIAAWLFEKMPLKPYDRAEIAFYSAGEIVRTEMWKALSPKAITQGKGFELARELDLITGVTDAQAAGVPLTVRQLESAFVWFAPNYTRSCLSLLADVFRGGYTGSQARRALGGMLGAGVAYYIGIQFAMSLLAGKDEDDAWRDVLQGLGVNEDPITGDITWRPTSQFMTVNVDNYNIGIGGFWYGFVRLVGNISDCINETGGKERIDLVKILENGSINKDNPFVYWWYSRSSPMVGTGFELAQGRDFLGYPIETPGEYAKYLITRFEPIWMEQGLNWMIPGATRDYEIPEGTARAAVPVFEMFGWRTFPESSWVKFYDNVKEYIKQIPAEDLDPKQTGAWEKGTLGWNQLTGNQQQALLQRYPELAQLYDSAQSDSKLRDSGIWKAYTDRLDEERAVYYGRIDEYTRRLQAGEIDTKTYRDLCSEAGQNYGSIMEAIERDPAYAEIYQYFAEKEAEGSKYQFKWDVAYAEYNSLIRFADGPAMYLANGDYNWEERDRRIADFVDKWGVDLYNEILDYINTEKEEKGLNPVWVRKGQDSEKLSREYWNLPYKPISQMTQEDFDQGNIPAKYYYLWNIYQNMSEEDREGFIALNPDLAKDLRGEYRKTHPEEDAMLALWGYSGKIQSMDAYNLLKKWSTELGIPMSQMGLGLPTENLMPAYFDYANLLSQFSGNTAEAKLWKLEHPEFTNWAMENWGWEGTEDYNTIEYYQLQIQWRAKEAEYNAIQGDIAKQQFLEANKDYWGARLTMRAMDHEVPQAYVNLYVQYYELPTAGYEQERFLMENQDYYKDVWVGILGNQPKDFNNIPTKEEEKLLSYYDGLATGTPRLQARCKDAELDAALVRIRGLTPAYGTSRCG